MALRGYIDYCEKKIPFVIEDYSMSLFSDDDTIIHSFLDEYRQKHDFLLVGQSYLDCTVKRTINILVERMIGTSCEIKCYIVGLMNDDLCFDSMTISSRALDSVFRYKYNFIDYTRSGELNEQKAIYSIPFNANKNDYCLNYKIGQPIKLGLLENFTMSGRIEISLNEKTIQECYSIVTLLLRFAKFMVHYSNIKIKKVILTENGFKRAYFFCKDIDEDACLDFDFKFTNFDVDKYSMFILNNIGNELGSVITNSIPVDHLPDSTDNLTPQRFIKQVEAFEYVFQNLEPKHERDCLKEKLELMLNRNPQLLSAIKETADSTADNIKSIRRKIAHGHSYYYDFNDNQKVQYNMLVLDKLIENMSLKMIGFNDEDIVNFRDTVF